MYLYSAKQTTMIKKLLSILSLLLFFNNSFSQSDYLFKCDFNPDDPEWTSYNKDNIITETRDGRFLMQHLKDESSWYQYREVYLNPNEDFEIILSQKQYRGENNQGFGLVFGAKDLDNCYVFDISSNGYFAIFKNVDEKYTKIVDWTKSKEIKPMLEVNILSVKNTSGKWHFLVNGKEVHSMPAQKTYGFYYGFYVMGLNYVEFDYLYIKQKAKPINLIDKYNSFGDKVHLGSAINSAYTEISPVISADEHTLYWTRDEHPQNIGDKKEDDIWSSKLNLKDSTWGPAKNVGAPWNTKDRNFLISISADNNTALLGNKYEKSGAVTGKGISVSHRTLKGWTIPKPMTIKNYYNYSEYTESCLTSDGSVLLITSYRDDTYGDKDIYVCFLQSDSSWSEPKNIGKVVNSFASEVGPFLAADNKTMYFSTAGHPGYGSNDIFMSRRLDESWTNWSQPKNLGPKINSAKWDAYYTVPASGKNAYVVSSTKGSKEDIYKVKQPETAKPLPLILVHGVVYDSETKKPMEADITYSELGSSKVLGHATSNPETGVFLISLPKGKKYSFHAAHDGYAAVHYNTDATKLDAYKEENIDLYLTPIKEGASIVMNNLFFTANKYDILPESYPELNKLYTLLLENPTIKIEIGGHTSINTSDQKFNEELSSNRAMAVKKYVVDKGIDAKRITSKGYGYSKPLYKTNKEEVQAKNRRVEFTILQK